LESEPERDSPLAPDPDSSELSELEDSGEEDRVDGELARPALADSPFAGSLPVEPSPVEPALERCLMQVWAWRTA
jgi:hypothetical protein